MPKDTIKDLRKLGKLEKSKKLEELHEELLILHSKNSMGSTLENPSRIKIVKRTIARLKTIMRAENLGIEVLEK
jgi:large subunit ribosomal protein L29